MDGGDFALAILCFFATIGMSYMLMSVIVRQYRFNVVLTTHLCYYIIIPTINKEWLYND